VTVVAPLVGFHVAKEPRVLPRNSAVAGTALRRPVDLRDGRYPRRMAVIPFGELDVYAIVDQDTDEARTFTTYLGYWDCLAELVTRVHGKDPYASILSALRANRVVTGLSGRPFSGPTAALRELLLNAWNSELTLYLVDPGDPKLQTANQWNSVYAYYATGRAAVAWLVARDGVAPSAHRPLLRALAAQVSGRNPLFPEPWSLACTRLDPIAYTGFATAPSPCSNLSSSVPPHDRAGLLLKTTRARRIDDLVADVKRRKKLTRAPNGERGRQDRAADATTVFDFTWRSRTRANYGDPSMYYMGTLTPERASAYIRSVRTFTAATMFVLETLVAHRTPAVVRDAGVHFTSRDRSGVSDSVLVPRLRALGLL